jgi:hypothetical protein
MSKHRYVSTCFWDDGYITKLDPSEKLLFIYLLTNPLTNISGVYQIERRRIAFDTGFDPEIVSTILKRFERDGKCLYRDGWVAMRNWIKHQSTSPKVRAGIATLLEEAPEELAKYTLGYSIDTVSDLNSNSNSISVGTPIASKSDTVSVPATTDPLYHAIEQAFLSQNGDRFTNYGKEGKAIHGIIAKAKARNPDDPGALVKAMMDALWRLKKSGDKFYAAQPFTPSTLNASGIWDRVLETMRTETIDPEVLEIIRGGAA